MLHYIKYSIRHCSINTVFSLLYDEDINILNILPFSRKLSMLLGWLDRRGYLSFCLSYSTIWE